HYYVYMLFDPNEKFPFYVGKGKDNRVFDHVNQTLADIDNDSLKNEKIKEIKTRGGKVKHIIVRHGITKEEKAFNIEASLIDTFRHCGLFLSNIMGGHNSIDKGLMTTNEVIGLYNAERLNQLGADCVIININGTYKRGFGSDAIYEATKGTWFISEKKIPTLKYVLSEYKGLIVQVFKVDKWIQNKRPKNKTELDQQGNPITDINGKPKMKKVDAVGYKFEGKRAPDDIRNLYINKFVEKIKGAANPNRYTL
ncbi:MAG: hypothetical protein ORN58_02510, partial [Sediminibacterium sp.]|nr:hypothetical protein [Sediminibacterium sp.]